MLWSVSWNRFDHTAHNTIGDSRVDVIDAESCYSR
jgi:hypothetical protein